jgi:hypothetical protein
VNKEENNNMPRKKKPKPYTGSVQDSLLVAYYVRGRLHRKDGPALEWNWGVKEYFWYGNFAEDKEQFEDKAWRKQARANPSENLRIQ